MFVIITGAVDSMVIDVQCIMQSIVSVAACYHTKIISTNSKAHITGATRIMFHEHDALNSAKEIVKESIKNVR